MNGYTTEERNTAYKMIAESYLINKYELDILDRKFAEYQTKFIPAPWRGEMEDVLQLKYISLLNRAHTERLNENDIAKLDQFIDGKADPGEVIDFVERTYISVLAGSPEPGVYVEFFPDIHEKGTFPGNAIVFIFSDIPEYDENGNRNIALEEKKNRVFDNVKNQFEDLVNDGEGPQVYLIRH